MKAVRWVVFIISLGLASTFTSPANAQSPCGDRYVIRYGDRLSKIARSCGTSLAALLEANPSIRNPNIIYPGQELIMPRIRGSQGPSISLHPNSGPPGSQIEITVSGVTTYTQVVISIGKKDEPSNPIKTVFHTNGDTFSTRVTIPSAGEGDEAWLLVASNSEPQKRFSAAAEFLVADAPSAIDGRSSGQEQLQTRDEDQDEDENVSTYVVQRGDSLGKIASRFKVPLGVLVRLNPNIKDPRLIYVGQTIIIPDSEQVADILSGDIENNPAIASVVDTIDEGERWIDVDLTLQRAYAYEGEQLVRSFIVSTGRANTPTVTGLHRVWIKLRYDDMRGPGYHLRNVPYVMYFYKGYGLHGTFWHNNFGTPMSHGCVNFSVEDAAWVFDFAEVGTLVHVHY